MQDDDYAPLAKNDYLEDGSESSESSATAASRPSSRWKKFRPWLLHGSLILVYTLITLAGLSSMSRNCNPEPKKWESNERNEIFSRAWDVVEYENVHFLGGLWTKTPYKGTPTKELDEEWDRLTATFLIDIPPSALEQLNKTSAAVALPPDTPHGLGGRYIGAVEVFHQLHCLNLIRKMTYESYYKETDDSWKDGPAMLRMHVDHCIDILRQKLTCDGDVSMITYSWIEGWPAPFPDFSNKHRCRKLDKIRDWNVENKVSVQVTTMTRTAGSITVPTPL